MGRYRGASVEPGGRRADDHDHSRVDGNTEQK